MRYIRAMPKLTPKLPPKQPPHVKIQRAKVIVDDTGIKRLTECELCGKEKHIAEGQTVCDECRSKPKRKSKS
jgi:hypothetical protein